VLNKFIKSAGRERWALVDQIFVSAANFGTTFLLVRFLGLRSFGVYVSLYAVMLYSWSWALALFMSPLLTIAPKILDPEERREYLTGSNTLQALFAALSGSIVGAGLAVFHLWTGNISLGSAVAVGIAAAAFQLQDGLRRFYFAQRRARMAFLNDLLSYGVQVVLIVLAGLTGRLSVTVAMLLIAVTSGLAVLVASFTEPLFGTVRSATVALRKSWLIGRDLLISTHMQWANAQGLLILAASLVGADGAGAIRVAQSIVGPFNVLFQAMDNVVPTQSADKMVKFGIRGVWKFLQKIMVAAGSVLIIPCALLILCATPLVHLAIGKSSALVVTLVIWQTAYVYESCFFRIASYFFRAIDRTRGVVVSTTVLLVTSLSLTAAFARTLGPLGVMVGLVSGQTLGLICATWYCMRELGRGASLQLYLESRS
jgi:O-antigen/teichoic acid export membrane protein